MKRTLLLFVAACGLFAQDLQYGSLGDFRLDSGEVIRNCKIAYRTFGTLNAARSNAVVFPTWFTGTTEQLKALIGPGKLADSSRFFVIAVDALGDGVSTSPSNSADQPRQRFPKFTIRDMVRSQHQLATQHLKLAHLAAVMGISMGGMQTFEWAVSYPDFMDRAVPIVGTPTQTATDLLLWNAELSGIEEDKDWNGGDYSKTPALKATALIHSFALTTPQYRMKQTPRSEFAKYLSDAEKSTSRFEANNWVRQLQAMMSHDVAHGTGLGAAADKVKARMLIVVAAQDHMVNPAPAVEFGRLLVAPVLELQSECGHLVTGCESERIVEQVNRFLR